MGVRQLGQESAVPGSVSLEDVAGKGDFVVDHVEDVQGKFGAFKVVYRQGGPTPEQLATVKPGDASLPNAPIIMGNKATAFGQFAKETPVKGTRMRITAQHTKNNQTAYIAEVVE